MVKKKSIFTFQKSQAMFFIHWIFSKQLKPMVWSFNYNFNKGLVDYYVADITTALDSAKCYFETYPFKVQNLHWLIPILKSFEFEKNELLRIHNRYYYPFGLPMDGRTFSSEKYRFGFNGMEQENEIQGSGNSYDFGARIYESRLGSWLSMDPLQAKCPSLSPYNFCVNNPIMFIDTDGKRIIIAYIDESGNPQEFEYKEGNNYDGSNELVLNVFTAIEQAKNYGGAETINKVVTDGQIVTIVEISWDQVLDPGENGGVQYVDKDPNNLKINWNTEAGSIDLKSGCKLKSERGLFHEIIHVEHYFKNKDKFLKLGNDKNVPDGWTDKEEYQTIHEENKVYGDEPNDGGKRKRHRGKADKSLTPNAYKSLVISSDVSKVKLSLKMIVNSFNIVKLFEFIIFVS